MVKSLGKLAAAMVFVLAMPLYSTGLGSCPEVYSCVAEWLYCLDSGGEFGSGGGAECDECGCPFDCDYGNVSYVSWCATD